VKDVGAFDSNAGHRKIGGRNIQQDLRRCPDANSGIFIVMPEVQFRSDQSPQ
jgi:hypothetical protein